jgi:tetratricopeptide (TPR) repeat protein
MFANTRYGRFLAPSLLLWFAATPQMISAQTADQSTDHLPAAPLLQQAPAAQPSQQLTPEQLGDSLVAHQRYQAAIAAYAKAPQMTASLWNKMGIAYQMMFNSRDATRCYRESLKLDPRNPHVLNNLGTVYASQKAYSQADRMYRKALKLDPRSAIILKNLGTDQLTEKKYNKGWESYQQALAINPQIFADHLGPTVENPSNVEDRGAMNYYMALGCARAGYADCALQYLRLALDEGFIDRKKVAASTEFASLRSNEAFQKLLDEQHSQ